MIHDIRLQYFRSYSDKSFTFNENVNIIVGKNGSGKTNLLEAVLVLASGGSFRVDDKNLVQFDHPWARLDGNFSSGARTVKLEKATNNKVNKDFIIDGKPIKRLSIKNSLPTVLFEPDHLQLLHRDPSSRRNFFDDLEAKFNPGYKTTLNSYKRALAQRNALLKFTSSHKPDQLFVWNIRLSELGSKIAATRQKTIENINQQISETYTSIAKKPANVKLVYVTKLDKNNYASSLLKQLEETINLDKERGFTSSGPHRDDFSFLLNGKQANISASRGEIRSLLLSLKIFELQATRDTYTQPPILLLDDVFSELDDTRQAELVRFFNDTQVIITTTSVDSIIRRAKGKVLKI